MNTLEKIRALVAEVQTMKPDDAADNARGLIELANLAAAFNFDIFDMLLPQTEAEADQLVDSLIALLFHVRGDDLPVFDLDRHVLDAEATGA